MNTKKEHLWQAYIDGELSATDMVDFEESLSESESRLLASDVLFDRALSEGLAKDAACPDDVWARTKALLEAQPTVPTNDTPKNPILYRRAWGPWGFATIVAAAMITLMVSWMMPSTSAPIILAEETVDELAAQSQVNANSADIERYMHENNYQLRLVAVETLHIVQIHSDVHLLGARRNYNGDVVELLVACCHQPVTIIIAERNTPLARIIAQEVANSESDVQATRNIGNYVAAVVSKHPAVGLLDIVAGQHL